MKKVLNIFFLLILLLCIKVNSIFSQPINVNIIWEKIANVGTMEFTPNGQYLITGGAVNACNPYLCGQIKIWRIADSALIRTIQNNNFGYTNDIAVSPDGQSFVTGHGSVYCAPNGGCYPDRPGQFKWDFSSGNLQNSENDPGGLVYAIDYSPIGNLIAAGTGYNNTGEIRIYNAVDFTFVRTLAGHYLETNGVEFTNDGQKLVSGGHDGKVKIWNVSDGMLIRTLDHGTYLNGGWDVQVAISPDGQLLASAGQGDNITIKIWRISDGQLLHTLLVGGENYGNYQSIQFSPNGIYIASGVTTYGSGGLGWHGFLKFWRVSDGSLAKEYIDTIGSPTSGGIRSIAFSSSGNNYFAYSIFNRLRIAYTDLNLVTLTSTSNNGNNIPEKFSLYQNYPNPFNPVTNIRFSIGPKTNSAVLLIIYDASGKEIQTLVNQKLSPGSYDIEFNGNNLSSGIYYYKLEAENLTEVRKMILLK